MAQETGLVGFKECREGLQEFSRTIQRNVGRRALMRPAQMIADAAQANAPVSSRPTDPTPGSLRASVKVVKGKGRVPNVAIVFDDVAAVPNEFGTSKMAAQPFLRPAVDSRSTAAIAAFGADLKVEVEKAAAKAAAKSKAAVR